MKIKSHYEPSSGRFKLNYDHEVQKLLAHAGEQLKPLLQANRPLTLKEAFDKDEDFEMPIMLLTQLGASQTADVHPEVLQSLLSLIAIQSSTLHNHNLPVAPFDQVLVLLSKVTPMLVDPVDLPPVSKAFVRGEISEIAWQAYETLQSQDKNGTPHLSAFQMYHLWLALKDLPRRNAGLKTLFSRIDTSLLPLHWAVEDLDLAEFQTLESTAEKKS